MADTTVTTLTECIPTIVGAALLELNEGNIIEPLITVMDFPGPGKIHQTPFIRRLVGESLDDLTGQALDSTTSDETSPSAATVGVHAAWVSLKDLASLTSVGDMAAVAGQLIGQELVTMKDCDLARLFTSLSTNQGDATTDGLAPADLYDAYGSLRAGIAPLPYHLVLNPKQIWSSVGLISLFDNSSDSINGGSGVGTVGEDFTRSGFSGMVMGFNLWADNNVPHLNTGNASGAAFSRGAIKMVYKRRLQIEFERQAVDLADEIVGSEIRGEAILRDKHGNEMQFPIAIA